LSIVEFGDTDPQSVAVQEMAQVTPLLEESPVTVADKVVVAPAKTVATLLERVTKVCDVLPPPQPARQAANAATVIFHGSDTRRIAFIAASIQVLREPRQPWWPFVKLSF
jgi:hypothetical protein